MSAAARKRILRERLAARRRSRPPRAEQAAGAARVVAERPEFGKARGIALYAALPDELSTEPLFRAAAEAGKRVALPRIRDDRGMEFALIGSFEDLRPGRYGVPEPREGATVLSLSELQLVVVPGVAFDRQGGRLGRGGGHYDRALAELPTPRPFLLGFAESGQIVEEVPREAHDVLVDAVATECEWIATGSEHTAGRGPGGGAGGA